MNLIELKCIRIRRGLTQSAIDAALNKERGWYHRCEVGAKNPTLTDVIEISKALTMNLSEVNLVFFDNRIPPV